MARALQSANEPDVAIRNYARCLLLYMDAIAPELPPPGAISVENKCGTVFTIRNSSAVVAPVRWSVDGSGEDVGEFVIRPRDSVTFRVFAEGTLRVYLGNDQVGTATSSKTECT